ncbi:MAG TPA: 30S ribosomal protein S2 [Rickettsiales bacterium]|nr:30S ribosomal protein S2 [Rickettsiales bacterium]
MALPKFTMSELIEAGAHFGHKTKRWNPKMAPYLFGVRNGLHIIDLQQTVPMLHRALVAVREVVAKNGRVLFVGTKRQAADVVAETAKSCGQYYINQRWLGGMLTNWGTIQASIKRLRKLEELLSQEETGLTKKELLTLTRDHEKLEKSLGGIKDMGGLPDLIFIIDTNKEDLAVKEAARLNIPVIGILDSNSSPDFITYPVPANDDATRAIKLYCQLIAEAAIDGLKESVVKSGRDIGASAEVPFAKPVNDSGKKEDKAEAKDAEDKKGKKAEKAAPVVVKKQAKLVEAEEAEAEEGEEKAPAKAKAAKPAKAAPKAKKA